MMNLIANHKLHHVAIQIAQQLGVIIFHTLSIEGLFVGIKYARDNGRKLYKTVFEMTRPIHVRPKRRLGIFYVRVKVLDGDLGEQFQGVKVDRIHESNY